MAYQSDVEKALLDHYSSLGYDAITSFPNGPSLTFPITTMNFAVETIFAKATASGLTTSAPDRHRGLFQVTIRVPKVGTDGNPVGTYAAYTAANAISTAFKRGTTIVYPLSTPPQRVQMSSPVVKHFPKASDTWYIMVVRAEFWADVYRRTSRAPSNRLAPSNSLAPAG